jgi:hypothetical protein
MMPVILLAFTGFTEENCRNSHWGHQVPWPVVKPGVSPGTSLYKSKALPLHHRLRYVIFHLQGHKEEHMMDLKAHALVTRTSSSGRFAVCLKSCRHYQATECRSRHLTLLLHLRGEPGSQFSPRFLMPP